MSQIETAPKMKWEQLISAKRFGMEHIESGTKHDRTDFQRDYDRLIFSSPFRRLQNKTQVFPLPGSIFVHNRLTHSLEVSCVGRSLGNNIANVLIEKYKPESFRKLFYDCGAIVSAACLAHDLGNPPFGHSGERAISAYFQEGNGARLESGMTPEEWLDIIHFEGNANAFRLLTHQFNGRRKGGFALTYSTLAAVVKYPFSSSAAENKQKFGFFTTEQKSFRKIASELGILHKQDNPLIYARHPLVYLVEAADDICYQIMDIEDSCKLKILTLEETQHLLLGFFSEDRRKNIERVLPKIEDTNEQIAYLRSCVIGELVDECSRVFIEHEEEILEGSFSIPLIKGMKEHIRNAYDECSQVAFNKIYRSSDVLDIEVAGYQIISTLLDKLIDAALYPDRYYSKLVLNRVPSQYQITADTTYLKVQAILDYISGMTDVYALDLYRKINGMSLPAL